jgi:hypothetical protein
LKGLPSGLSLSAISARGVGTINGEGMLREFPARMHKSKKTQRIIRQVGVQAFRDSSKASIQPG